MENEALKLLNTLPTGTFIAIAAFLIGILVTIGMSIYKVSKRFEKKIRDDMQDDLDHTQLVETVNALTSKIESIGGEIKDLRKALRESSQNNEQWREDMSKKVDESDKVITETKNLLKDQLSPRIQELENNMYKVSDSNMGAIKSFIISEYHKWMERGYIDVYSLSLIEDRYKDYSKNGGNTFILDLMNQLRSLDIKPMIIDKKTGKDPIQYFTKPENRAHLPDNCTFYDDEDTTKPAN